MNSPLDESQLGSFEHMNRAQKRAFILRDQLKYDEEQHLDVFIEGIRSPEPPRYKRTSSGVQPAYEEVTIKHSTTRFDLGNVEFSDKSVRRVHLACVGDSYEMHESDAILPEEDDFNSVPLNYYVAQKIMPSFKKKYEAIHARVQRINDVRKHVYEQACNRPPKASSRFKEGKSLAKLMSSERDTESIQSAEDSRKRPSDSITRHPLNKKKRISVDNVSSAIKTETVNRLPDQTKVDLFNAFVKSAFPDLDNLLMASWNVVSIFVNVGSEDLMLHNSIGDLHEVLLRFDEFLGKKKRAGVNANGGAAAPRNDIRNGSVRNTPLPHGPGTLDGSGDPTVRDRSRDRLVEIATGADGGAHAISRAPSSSHTTAPRRSNTLYNAEGHPVNAKTTRHHGTPLAQQQHHPSLSQHNSSSQSVPEQPSSRRRPQSLEDLFTRKAPKELRPASHDILDSLAASIEEDTVSAIEVGYANMQAQKPSTPPTAGLDKPPAPKLTSTSASTRGTGMPTGPSQPAPEQTQTPAQRSTKRYGMFTPSHHHQHSISDSRLDSLFVGDSDDEHDNLSDDEAVQVSGLQEIDLELENQTNSGSGKMGGKKPVSLGSGSGSGSGVGLGLGKSMLGAPKRPPNAMGDAPVAPMMHVGGAGEKESAGEYGGGSGSGSGSGKGKGR